MKIRVAILLVLLVVAAGCGTSRSVQQRSDDDLLQDVRSKITEVYPGPLVIQLSVKDAVVILEGRVGSEEERRKIGDAANGVRGVKSVINNLQSH